MKNDTPLMLAVATYASRDAAVEDFHGVMEAKTEAEFDHIAVSVLAKDVMANEKSSVAIAQRSTAPGQAL